jgi:hypothetical protein
VARQQVPHSGRLAFHDELLVMQVTVADAEAEAAALIELLARAAAGE